MAVMHIIDVAIVLDRGVAAVGPVLVVVSGVMASHVLLPLR